MATWRRPKALLQPKLVLFVLNGVTKGYSFYQVLLLSVFPLGRHWVRGTRSYGKHLKQEQIHLQSFTFLSYTLRDTGSDILSGYTATYRRAGHNNCGHPRISPPPSMPAFITGSQTWGRGVLNPFLDAKLLNWMYSKEGVKIDWEKI